MSKKSKKPNSPVANVSGKFPILQQKDDIKPFIKFEFMAENSWEPAGQQLFHISIPQLIIAAQSLTEHRYEIPSVAREENVLPFIAVEFDGTNQEIHTITIKDCTPSMVLIAARWLDAHVSLVLMREITARMQQQQPQPQLVVPTIIPIRK